MKDLDTLKILAVEDEWAQAKLIEIFLTATTQINIDITHVETLKQCLNAIKEDNYDVVLLDLDLEDSRGIETLDKLLEVSPSVSIVVLGDTNDQKVGVKAIQKGAQDYINKSHLDTATLMKAVVYAYERNKLVW